MILAPRSILDDRQVIELLKDEPELLAIADALCVTHAGPPQEDARARVTGDRRMRRMARGRRATHVAAVAVALTVVVAVLALLSEPFGWGGPTIEERALGAVGSQPVLHVVVENQEGASPLRDLATGRGITRSLRTEIWFDEGRDLKKTVLTLDGEVLDEQLETSAGGWSSMGPIYTCAWIAAHPAAAAKAGVDCDEGSGGDQAPSLDQALAGFVDGYRSALASGDATRLGNGSVDGRKVVWLGFSTTTGLEEVAVDANSFKPIQVTSGKGTARLRVQTAETIPFDPTLFSRPESVRVQSGGAVSSEVSIPTEVAAHALGGPMVWLGSVWGGLRLVSVTQQDRTVSSSEGELEHARVIRLAYIGSGAQAGARVDVFESRTCLVRVGWTCTPRDPQSSAHIGFPLGADGPVALLRKEGLYVSIWTSQLATEHNLFDVAHALEVLHP